jgi:hypothetical protein
MKQTYQTDIQGEGNYTAAKQYDDATKKFAESGKVAAAAKNAAPKNDKEASAMQKAEAEGKSHAKGGKAHETNMDRTTPDLKTPPAHKPVAQKTR